ncbi:hypothetical protein [Flavobacterium sp. J27]|uniref:hypothetical protein n=1 Tax=Flavobacterium sp. J27 TaxID=2060419 RepID=UPI001030A6CD|nr:hypothetical protein [Flavobacterium sp. J27]
MKYLVIAESFKKYNLVCNNSILGTMTYKGWLNTQSPSFTRQNEKSFKVEKPSIWKSNFKISIANQVLFEFLFKWNGKIEIKVYRDNVVETIILKLTHFWKSKYGLLDESGKEIVTISSKYNWKTWKTNYTLTENVSFHHDYKEIVYLSAIHCIIILKNRAAAAAA